MSAKFKKGDRVWVFGTRGATGGAWAEVTLRSCGPTSATIDGEVSDAQHGAIGFSSQINPAHLCATEVEAKRQLAILLRAKIADCERRLATMRAGLLAAEAP